MLEYIIFIVSVVGLIASSSFLIKEAENISNHFKISPYIIGATVIAVGTSLPEITVSGYASYLKKGDIAIGNALGSAIFNIALILGVVFLIAKNLKQTRDIFKKESIWTLLPIFMLIIMIYDGCISRFDGFLFIFVMIAYIIFLFEDHKSSLKIQVEEIRGKFNIFKSLAILLASFVLLISCASFTIDSATAISLKWGVSELFISVMLIALGTSLPELAVGISAARKKNGDILIGNIIGSNIANFSIGIGISAIVNPIRIAPQTIGFEILTILILSFMLIFMTANRLYNKSSGIVLIAMLVLIVKYYLANAT